MLFKTALSGSQYKPPALPEVVDSPFDSHGRYFNTGGIVGET